MRRERRKLSVFKPTDRDFQISPHSRQRNDNRRRIIVEKFLNIDVVPDYAYLCAIIRVRVRAFVRTRQRIAHFCFGDLQRQLLIILWPLPAIRARLLSALRDFVFRLLTAFYHRCNRGYKLERAAKGTLRSISYKLHAKWQRHLLM